MKASPRDDGMDRLLRRTARDAPAHGCPDAEALAAWTEEGLSSDERAAIESHLADCARCQMQLASLVRMAPADSSAPRLRLWPWLVPAAGAAAATVLWLVAQSPQTAPPAAPPAQPSQAEQLPNAAKDAPVADAPAIEMSRPGARAPFRERRARGEAAPAPAAPAARAPAASAPAAPVPESKAEEFAQRQTAENIAALRDTEAERDRFENLAVERLPDGSVRWDPRSAGVLSRVTAGASPTPSVMWLVGRGGLVLRTDDGRTWRRVPFPERADLVSVRATTASDAIVSTSDARTFATTDAGVTWVRQ